MWQGPPPAAGDVSSQRIVTGMQTLALARLPFVYPLIGVVAMLLLGQLAVLWPALRASAVPPASAARSV